MQPNYCYSYIAGNRPSMRLVGSDYVPEAGEQLSLGEAATVDQLEIWFPGSTIATLRISVVSAAMGTCNFVTSQISTGLATLTGYANAASSVDASGNPPANDPGKSAFAALAAGNGMTSGTLAALVANMRAASMQQLGTLATLKGAAAAAASAADLAQALTAFEVAIAAEVAAINSAGLTAKIALPAPILIAGINA